MELPEIHESGIPHEVEDLPVIRLYEIQTYDHEGGEWEVHTTGFASLEDARKYTRSIRTVRSLRIIKRTVIVLETEMPL